MDHLICFWKSFHFKHLENKEPFPPALLWAAYEGHVLFSEPSVCWLPFYLINCPINLTRGPWFFSSFTAVLLSEARTQVGHRAIVNLDGNENMCACVRLLGESRRLLSSIHDNSARGSLLFTSFCVSVFLGHINVRLLNDVCRARGTFFTVMLWNGKVRPPKEWLLNIIRCCSLILNV